MLKNEKKIMKSSLPFTFFQTPTTEKLGCPVNSECYCKPK